MMDYDSLMSENVRALQPSGIRKFFDILDTMKGAISLGIGEPDFTTPWHIREAGVYSLEQGFTKYTSNAGLSRLLHKLRPLKRDIRHRRRLRGDRPVRQGDAEPRR